MSDFSQDAFVKIVNVNGDYHYGFIKDVQERGFHLVICLHEEGDSAVAYEAGAGIMTKDWEKMLSDAEESIVPLLAQSLSTKDIAARLDLSPHTIRAQIRTLRIKLQLENRQQLVSFAQGMEPRLEALKE